MKTTRTQARKGAGSLRERAPGVWEIRVAAGVDPATGRTIQRSVTFRGDAAQAQEYRGLLAAEHADRRSPPRPAPLMTVGQLLRTWLAAEHDWRPSTAVGYAATVRALLADPALAEARVAGLSPQRARATMARWRLCGASNPVIAGRFRVLRSALGWAYTERLIDVHPLRGMRGPGRAAPRKPLPDAAIASLLASAETAVLSALANDNGGPRSRKLLQGAERDLLMTRLAADSGARRGELVALRFGDLDGRVLHLERAVSAEQVGQTKSGHARALTLGGATAALWHTLARDWQDRAPDLPLGPWVFAADSGHRQRLTAGALTHRFHRLTEAAGLEAASLHRLRHSVATFLVARGEILQAQARLGHADAATTLREYAYALPLTDAAVADAIDAHLDGCDRDDQPMSAADLRDT
jgi:integrase